MSSTTYLHTRELLPGDTLLVGASTVSVDTVAPDEMDDDYYWLYATCVSGNFD